MKSQQFGRSHLAESFPSGWVSAIWLATNKLLYSCQTDIWLSSSHLACTQSKMMASQSLKVAGNKCAVFPRLPDIYPDIRRTKTNKGVFTNLWSNQNVPSWGTAFCLVLRGQYGSDQKLEISRLYTSRLSFLFLFGPKIAQWTLREATHLRVVAF